MRKGIICAWLFLMLSTSELLAQQSADISPVELEEELTETRSFERERMSSREDFTVPRKQVLLEIATATW
ncbi:MAG: hypothetical protein GTO24_28190 [candidate division Zixibacteria bacterium]|nr:hypothetical protein [candidate division Zixibacteria bacterium]